MDIWTGLSRAASSYTFVLIKAVFMTDGPVLEMGMGFNSTPLLHWLCGDTKRRLISYENNPDYFNALRKFRSRNHLLCLVDDWDKINIAKPWDVAFIDHSPAERRVVDIRRVANLAKLVIVHDTEKTQEYKYHYSEIYPLFKYHFQYTKHLPHTSVLSNFKQFKL